MAKASTMSNYQAGTIKTDKQSLTCRKAFLLTPHTLLWPGHMSPVPSARHMVCCRLSLGKTSHAMPCNTIHDLIATRTSHGLLSPVTGKTSHVMSCHTIHILIAIRISRGLLLPVTGENKSCHVISCHATLYMSLLPSERHMVCCRLSLWEASHAITDCTVPYHTCHCHQHATRSAVASHWGKQVMPCQSLQYHTTLQSARHTVCCRFSLGQQSHTTHIPHQLSQHTILQHTAPYTPFYIIPHHTTSCHTI